jgi:hypothetical protein
MGFFDRLFGREETNAPTEPQYRRSGAPTQQRSEDEIAVERYRYLLRTAPPETIEEVHREAFAKLTPEQRTVLFDQLTANAPAGDKPLGQDAASLATSATRSELRQPGTMERSMTGGGAGGAMGGMGFGSMMASSLLGTVAGYVIGSALMSSFLPAGGFDGGTDGSDASDGGEGSESGAEGGDSGDVTSADGGDYGGGDYGGGDFGGGDYGGGDFGGFGGGDFGGGGDF